MTALKLRPYQTETIEALNKSWTRGILRPAVVLPTGLGKTVIFSHLAHQAHMEGRRPLILVHREELVSQTIDKIHQVAPGLSVGVVKAERREVGADVLVGSVQTLARQRRRDEVTGIGLVIVDEAHHAAADSYINILKHFGCYDAVRACGFTATMSRNDTRGLGDVWQDVVYRKDILWGILKGYLADVRGKQVTVDGLNLTDVARSRGDYQEGALGDALTEAGAGEVIAQAYVEHAADRQGVLFAPTVATAHEFAADLNAAGIITAVITGTTPTEERHLIYKQYRNGEIQVLSSCLVLTEGFDMPQASCAVIARPTSSQGLYVQMVGRVLRPMPGKDALVLDVAGVSSKLKLASLVDLTETKLTLEPDESLSEAADRLSKARKNNSGRGMPAGDLDAVEVDLFHRSKSAWLRTHGGLRFIPTRDNYYLLWPNADGTFRVGRTPNKGRGGVWLHEDLSLEYAMAWAEQEAEEEDPSISQRGASWRKRGGAPSDKQIAYALCLNIPLTGEMTKAELSDLISIHFASDRFDRHLSKSA